MALGPKGSENGSDRIDLIDVDHDLFVLAARPEAAPRRARVPWGPIGAVGVVALATFVLWPRTEPPEWQLFHPAPVPAAGMSDELIFDRPPGPLLMADLAPPPVDLKPESGYVFGEPGGTITTRRWASFRTRSSSLATAPGSAAPTSVRGVHADIHRIRMRLNLAWGPVDGRTWSATTNHLSEEEALDFANNVGFVDGSPAIAYGFDLHGMEPLGSVAALDCVVLLTDMLRGERGRGAEQPTVLTWETLDGTISLGSIAAPSDALPLVEFVLGAGRPTVVHNQPAVTIAARTGGNTVIAWIEDGRLVMVTGDASDEKLLELAQSVRPADEGEWRSVGRVALQEQTFSLVGEGVKLYRGDDGATGDEFDVTATVFAPGEAISQLVVCVNTIDGETARFIQACSFKATVPPLLYVTQAVNGRRFVVAFVDAEEGETAELRVELTEGTWTLPFEHFSSELPGWAVVELLPRNFGAIELWSAGELVAAV